VDNFVTPILLVWFVQSGGAGRAGAACDTLNLCLAQFSSQGVSFCCFSVLFSTLQVPGAYGNLCAVFMMLID
jgi:hypothetical protein